MLKNIIKILVQTAPLIAEVGKRVIKNIDKIKPALQEAWNTFKTAFSDKSKEVATKAGNQKAYDKDTATAQQTQEVNNNLNDFKNDLLDTKTATGKHIDKMSEVYASCFDDLIKKIEEINQQDFGDGLKFNLPISKINSKRKKIIKEVKDKLKYSISSQISLDNPKICEVLKRDEGSSKRDAMQDRLSSIIKQCFSTLQQDLTTQMQQIPQDLKHELESSCGYMTTIVERDINTLRKLQQSEGKEFQEKEKEQLKLEFLFCKDQAIKQNILNLSL